jgi:hypothetical protein
MEAYAADRTELARDIRQRDGLAVHLNLALLGLVF